MVTLQGLTLAFLAAPEGVEQRELASSWQAVLEAGGQPRLLSTRAGRIQAYRHLDRADTFAVDAVVGEEPGGDPGGYAGLVLPGGVANPDFLRLDAAAVAFVRACCTAGTPVAAICHAPWLLIEAGVVRGRTLTSWPSLRTDLENAGATWVNEQVQVCTAGPGPLITSRKPADLPLFNDALVAACAERRGKLGPWER
ncbi:type 1 glutamine amidotransferase domain-containing protein [Kitasatospora sp. LaBMicrA B282]|uniref:type 1 glutamine amidotransferase domain-containing protein n=1 Tax=Kitasatospora sp. LaBMicrA B282 TaxID=3420949 RepID=UPI003D12A66E